ncbi:MAG: DUF3887 domain-containing protein [Bacteroidia bacterium]|nr:DUF3887 domain-containing protein [Bacteroidia bacterium]NNJ56768.1 DUF3887 domain-containing protein [Bacteroidia bacterium]
MKSLLAFTFLLISFSSVAQKHSIEDVAVLFSKHKYAKVYKCFDDNMKDNISVEQLQELWERMESGAGKYVGVEDVVIEQLDENLRQTAVIKFESAAVKLIMSESEDKEINGLFVSQLGYEAPPYAKDLVTGKKRINFLSHSYNISGELMLPITCNNCPVVILVHGSGPNDKDETIGPNKVFKDLALGLAANGIATFRYNKRSNLYPETIKGQFDIYDETINDAISAYHTLSSDTSLRLGKTVMLGHSLGAYSMPLIADSLKEIDGAILFSSNARRLEDLIEYQMHYLTNWDDILTKEEVEIVELNTARAEDIRTNNYTDTTSAENLLAYWPGTFWKGIDTYNPVEQVKSNTTTPFFIMQGEKDYQITMVDFELWTEGVGKQNNVRLKSYPNLTHLFTPTESDKPGPNDYFLPTNVDEEVVKDIAEWVKKL